MKNKAMHYKKRTRFITVIGGCVFLLTGLLIAEESSTDSGTPTEVDTAVDSTASDVSSPTPSGTSGDQQTGMGPEMTDQKYAALMAGLTIFALAVFVGFEVITKVPQKLHTPLMSGSNAISGITIVGAILVVAKCATSELGPQNTPALAMVGLAIAMAMINVVGGFGVTHRMLSMFVKRKKKSTT